MHSGANPYSLNSKGLIAAIRVTARASRDLIGDVVVDAAGMQRIKVYVRAVQERNRANTAVIKLLSKYWQVPQRDIQVITGGKVRDKLVLIRGAPHTLSAIVSRIH